MRSLWKAYRVRRARERIVDAMRDYLRTLNPQPRHAALLHAMADLTDQLLADVQADINERGRQWR